MWQTGKTLKLCPYAPFNLFFEVHCKSLIVTKKIVAENMAKAEARDKSSSTVLNQLIISLVNYNKLPY